ncbi:glucosamine-6-phosphate deaminase [Kocuria sp. WRN011]|uniref:glucosamine-6-phosphate deaminase n=1 Tax=Kocuria sp. WRN011 TaxID=2029858 RepID=UPI000BAFDF3D|nr:glucosamine-6-phosphate deaminase [Kocuria sp. WRN011]
MRLVLCESVAETGQVAAEIFASRIEQGPCVLGLATGSSPLPVYQYLIRRYRESGLSFAQCTAFTLDEYVGLQPYDSRSYRATIRDEFVDHVDLPTRSLHSPDAADPDPRALRHAAAAYEETIRLAGGIDVQLLGIGANGHIGFNEPSSSLASRTRIKALTQQTREDNARFLGEDETVPKLCLTQGLGTILDSRHAVLVAQGEAKADAVAAAVEGPVSSACPASVLQLHPHATVILDAAAASRLQNLDYYRHVQHLNDELGLLP